jgi:hypothetical protein
MSTDQQPNSLDAPESTSQAEQAPGNAWLRAVRANPGITAFNVLCLCIGLAMALTHLPAEWSLARRLTAGALSGVGGGLVITANRMLGAWR